MAMSAGSSGLFTVKEINRIKTLQDVIDRWLTPGRAAEHLGITPVTVVDYLNATVNTVRLA